MSAARVADPRDLLLFFSFSGATPCTLSTYLTILMSNAVNLTITFNSERWPIIATQTLGVIGQMILSATLYGNVIFIVSSMFLAPLNHFH